jgi:hypothetical protein
MEETPEQVLARLERYAARIGVAAPAAVPPRPVAPPAGRAAPTAPVQARFVPAPIATRPELWRIAIEAMGYVVGLGCCLAAIFAFQRLDRTVASVTIAALVLAGVIATMRRFPLALWWTLGFAIGGIIARLS